MRKQWIVEGLLMMIVCLYVFVVVNKLVGFDPFVSQLKQQQLLRDYATLIAIGVPLVHSLLVVLIILPKTRSYAILASMLVIGAYTLYIGFNLQEKFGLAPCNCVGIWHTMSWETQYIINFVILASHYYCFLNLPSLKEDPPLLIHATPILR